MFESSEKPVAAPHTPVIDTAAKHVDSNQAHWSFRVLAPGCKCRIAEQSDCVTYTNSVCLYIGNPEHRAVQAR